MFREKKVQKRFLTNRWDEIRSLINQYRVTCSMFTKGPFNKGTRALYYSSKNQKEETMECYQKFLKCKPQSEDVKLIMESMFEANNML